MRAWFAICSTEFIFPRNDISNSPYQLSNLEASTPLSRSSHRSIFSNCQFPITFHALFQSCSYRSILEKRGGDVTFHGRWQSSETDSKISFRQTTLDKLCNDLFNRLWTVGRQTVKFNYNLLYLLTRHNKPDSRVCFRPTSSRQTSSMNSHCFSSRFSIRERKIARPLRGKLLLRRYIIFHISILPL